MPSHHLILGLWKARTLCGPSGPDFRIRQVREAVSRSGRGPLGSGYRGPGSASPAASCDVTPPHNVTRVAEMLPDGCAYGCILSAPPTA